MSWCCELQKPWLLHRREETPGNRDRIVITEPRWNGGSKTLDFWDTNWLVSRSFEFDLGTLGDRVRAGYAGVHAYACITRSGVSGYARDAGARGSRIILRGNDIDECIIMHNSLNDRWTS